MSNINNTIAGLELAQIGWVVPNIYAGVKFLANALGIAGFPQTGTYQGTGSGYDYYGKALAGEWLTKRWGLPPRLWASRQKDGSPSNKCRRPGEDLFGMPFF